MDTEKILSQIENHGFYDGQISSCRKTPANPGRYLTPDPPLKPPLDAALTDMGITRLYEHQAASLEAVRRGQSILVETPTASGKSLCFHLPVLEGLHADPDARALYLFPTKALARDQLGKVQALAPHIRAGVYDADTPRGERRRLRGEARLLFSNPDLLHLGILPYHLHWAGFFANLRYVVIDEIHTYRGVFGTHVSHVIRRLRRIAAAHGSSPQFILASATIGNPADHAERLTGLPINLIRGGAAPRGERTFALWDAYRAGRKRLNLTQTAYLEDAVWLLATLLVEGVRTIVFTRSRQVTEWLLVYLARYLEQCGETSLLGKVRAYRGGYLPEERRAIERQLFSGELLGVVSTSALELGVDIGGLEAAILAGYPGTMASLWQQAGRAGRRGDPSLCFFVPGPNVLERYLLQHPDYFFGRPFEQAVIDPENPYILVDHISAAAFEWPLSQADLGLWGEIGYSLAGLLTEEGLLTENPGGEKWYYAGQGYPAARISLRGSGGQWQLISGGETIGTIDSASAQTQVYPGAVYLHGGETYLVQNVARDRNQVMLERAKLDYYTEAMESVTVEVLQEHQNRAAGPDRAFLGELKVTAAITGFRRRHAVTGVVLGHGTLDVPPYVMETIGFWLAIPAGRTEQLTGMGRDPAGGLHGLEHLLIGLLPLVVLCDRWDVAGTSTLFHPAAAGPAVFVYDAAPGGSGFTERAFESLPVLMERAREALTACRCYSGCPSCIQSPKCGSLNQPLDKEATKEILSWMWNEDRCH